MSFLSRIVSFLTFAEISNTSKESIYQLILENPGITFSELEELAFDEDEKINLHNLIVELTQDSKIKIDPKTYTLTPIKETKKKTPKTTRLVKPKSDSLPDNEIEKQVLALIKSNPQGTPRYKVVSLLRHTMSLNQMMTLMESLKAKNLVTETDKNETIVYYPSGYLAFSTSRYFLRTLYAKNN